MASNDNHATNYPRVELVTTTITETRTQIDEQTTDIRRSTIVRYSDGREEKQPDQYERIVDITNETTEVKLIFLYFL